jgi:hypothetical protein
MRNHGRVALAALVLALIPAASVRADQEHGQMAVPPVVKRAPSQRPPRTDAGQALTPDVERAGARSADQKATRTSDGNGWRAAYRAPKQGEGAAK